MEPPLRRPGARGLAGAAEQTQQNKPLVSWINHSTTGTTIWIVVPDER
jgi:hypothetical protein